MGVPNDNFAKTICSICYEDLKPIVEDLQAISICGHQWFEYCAKSKKQTCPVCKQACTAKNVGRLYFQSVGDPVLSQSQIPIVSTGDADRPEVLRREVKRLENKVSGLVSSLDQHQKDVQQLTSEVLQVCKEQLSKEVILKNEVLRQKECIQSMLQTKSSDLVKSTLECSRLQEKNLGLAKEIAALKLVSDCNLEEDEIVKLASLGNDSNSQDAIDVLKKSLFIRNKSYKELMAKCNALGRGEARSLKKLEKAKEKITKLKMRVQELETAIEAKDNEVLRYLKNPKKKQRMDVSNGAVDKSTDPLSVFKDTPAGEKVQCPPSVINLDEDANDNSLGVKEMNNSTIGVNIYKGHKRTIEPVETPYFDNEDELQAVGNSSKAHHGTKGSCQEAGSLRPVDSNTRESSIHRDLAGCADHIVNDHPFTKDVPGLSPQDIKQVQPSPLSTAEGPPPILLAEPGTINVFLAKSPGDRCFAGGLLGPDGVNRYLGKWCRRAQNKAAGGSTHGPSNVADGLIAVGADGRGGRIKVLRSTNQTPMDMKENMVSAKRLKSAPKSSGLQSQGCLQIEHFFGKASN
ncbi:hypothetical protein Cgig2_000487 [Carnegiea gigantea]|uniref:RING-type domain-containing protein n=1 Tax=Carnegiea gigantea TaxID=171969 RepID=A0A9Q1GZL0_9CARY|nr:hypothetical protein Cgig2_000487 [Carnegiea gigantea]